TASSSSDSGLSKPTATIESALTPWGAGIRIISPDLPLAPTAVNACRVDFNSELPSNAVLGSSTPSSSRKVGITRIFALDGVDFSSFTVGNDDATTVRCVYSLGGVLVII